MHRSKNKIVLSFFLVTVYGSLLAAPTPFALEFRANARAANSRVFRAKLQVGLCESKLARTLFLIEENIRLGKASSLFESADSRVEVLRARFELSEAKAGLAVAETEEQIWRLRADWELKKAPVAPKELAHLNLKIQQTNYDLALELSNSVGPVLDEVSFKYNTAIREPSGTYSKDTLNKLKLTWEDAKGLAELARQRVGEAEQLRREANDDIAAAAH